MTSQGSAETAKSASVSRSETPVVPLKHQHSFEERYAAIINQEILENTINKEALQRQVQAYFPVSRSSSRECTKEKQMLNTGNNTKEQESHEQENIIQKLDTLDIKDNKQNMK